MALCVLCGAFEFGMLRVKLLFLSIFCRYSRYFVGTNDMLVGLHVPTNFLIYRQTVTLSKCMCMRASGASELRKFWHFYILNLLFLSIFCRYIFRYFVGTNDMLVGSHVPTNFQMYRQKSEKALLGGGQLPPPPSPPLATLMVIQGGGIQSRSGQKKMHVHVHGSLSVAAAKCHMHSMRKFSYTEEGM